MSSLASQPLNPGDVRTADPHHRVPADVVRVCHVSMSLLTGGLERLLVDFSRFHDRRRFAMQFVAFSGDGQPATDLRAAGCSALVLNDSVKIRKLSTVIELSKLLRSERIQILHTHNTYAHFYGALAAKLAGVPVVVNTQHGRGCGKGWKARWQFRMANWLTQRVVGVSHDAAELCRREDPSSADKISTIWNGINLDQFAYRGPMIEPTAISIARLSAGKDFPTLFKAVQLVLRHLPDFRLRIVGDGPERATLERLIHELSLREHIELLGERHDVSDLLAKSGFFVSSSRSEGLSLTLLEAMAVGLPIVTTSVGGNPEIVVEGHTGRLIPDRDPAALAAAMVEMCHEREAWIAMGLLGRKRVEQYFEIRQMVASYEALYEELMSGMTNDEIPNDERMTKLE